jgi:hypothetical protein
VALVLFSALSIWNINRKKAVWDFWFFDFQFSNSIVLICKLVFFNLLNYF